MSEEPIEPSGLGDGLTTATPEPTPSASPSGEAPAFDFSSEDTYNQFVASLPDEIKTSKAINETKDLTSLANQFLNAQSALGKKRLEAPSDDWGEDQWNDFYDNIRPDGGEYSVPDEVNIPEEFGEATAPEFTDDAIQELVNFAGNLGLNQQQFDALYNRWALMSVENNQLESASEAETLTQYKTAMLGEWGGDFDINLKNSKEAFTTLANEIPELNQLIENPVVANHPATLKLFNKLSSLIKDSTPVQGSNLPSGFGNGSVQGIKNEIAALDESSADLILANPSQMNLSDRSKREQILAKRAKLYEQLYDK